MQKAKQFISHLVYNKFFWEIILAAFMIGAALFFIKNEHVELIKIQHQLEQSHVGWIIAGILFTGIYILFQGLMYVHSFKALNQKVPLHVTIILFLKRNFVSVFLPAGGFSSLAFFTKEVEKYGPGKSQIYLASTLFGFIGILSVVVVSIPALAIAMILHDLHPTTIAGFIFLLLLSLAFILSARSISRKKFIYRQLIKIWPSFAVILDEMLAEKIRKKEVINTLLVSVGIEFIGISHLYISMRALGFEASMTAAIIGYIVMVILLVASPFLRGLGAIEISLTYVLDQFGFPLLSAAAITLLFRFFEFWLPLIAGIFSFFTRKDNVILRILPAFIIFVLGVVNILSAITPAIPARLRLVHNLLPETLVEGTNILVLVFGLFLVILSVFLVQGSRRACNYGLLLTGFSFAGHLIKAADYEEAILALIAFGTLLYTRENYKLKPHPKLTQISYKVLAFSIVSVFSYGVLGFYFIEKKHFGHEFEFWTAIKNVFHLFFFFGTPPVHPLTQFGSYFIDSIYISGVLVFMFITFSILKPYFSQPFNSEQDLETAKKLVEQYGKSQLDYFKIYPDKFFFFSENRDAFISFKVTRHFALVLEDPVCGSEESFKRIVQDFDRFCAENGFIIAYYRVPARSVKLFEDLGKKSMLIGEEAVVNLQSFTLEGGKMRPTRSAITRLNGMGIDIKIHTPPIQEGLLQKLEHVSNEWLRDLDRKEIAFTQGVFDKTILKNQTILTVEDKEEKVYAFLNLIPDYAPGEATYDLIRKISDTPNGVLDLLLIKTILYLKEQGFESVNMGLAPLSGLEGVNLAEKTIKYAYDNLKMFGHFKGLRKYKEKFFPKWEKKYLIYSHNYHLLQVPNALKRVSEGS